MRRTQVRIHRLAVLVLGSVMAWAASAPAAAAFSVAYDQRMTSGGRVIPSKVKARDGRFRIESVVDNIQAVIIRAADGAIYQYMPGEQMAMKMPSVQGLQGPAGDAKDYASYLQQRNAQRLGDETVNGIPCG